MIESTFLIFSIYSTLGVTYLLGRRAWIWYHKQHYIKWLAQEQKEIASIPLQEDVEMIDQPAVILPYEREFVERESVEEREWRVERDYLSKKTVEATK